MFGEVTKGPTLMGGNNFMYMDGNVDKVKGPVVEGITIDVVNLM